MNLINFLLLWNSAGKNCRRGELTPTGPVSLDLLPLSFVD